MKREVVRCGNNFRLRRYETLNRSVVWEFSCRFCDSAKIGSVCNPVGGLAFRSNYWLKKGG